MRSRAIGMLLLSAWLGCSAREAPQDVPPREGTRFTTGEITDPRAPFAAGEETRVTVTPKAAGYSLPLELSQVTNLERDIRGKQISAVTGAAATKLAQHGFVIVPAALALDHVDAAYSVLKQDEVPIFITSDSVLHLYHLFFDQILKYLEVSEFSSALGELLPALIQASRAQQQGFTGELQEAARRNVAFLSVAAQLLDPEFTLPAGVPEAQAELELIDKHAALAASPLMNHDCPAGCDPCGITPEDVKCQAAGACTCEDYTQYIPRGHYTVSPELERYFKAMMWLGRIGFRLRSSMESIEAVLLTDALNTAPLTGKSAAEIWHRIYDVTAFLVGAADDLTFFEYQGAIKQAFGDSFDLAELARPEQLAALRAKLEALRSPKILSGFTSAFLDETEATKGWRFMGQRFAPDSYVLGQMVWDHIGANLKHPAAAATLATCAAPQATCSDVLSNLELSNCLCFNAPEICRLLPKGLDVMAVLGSTQAATILAPDRDYCGFEAQLASLQSEFKAYRREDWRQSTYWYWLDALSPLLASLPEGYPNWMRTPAWATKQLNTALTSWAELRHDTILYVKQSYTPATAGAVMPPPEAFGSVEPVPAFYARLKDLAAYTRLGLEQHQALPAGLAPHLESLEGLLAGLTAVAVHELENKALTEEETTTIKNIGSTFEAIILGLAKAVTVKEPSPAWGNCETEPNYCEEHNDLQGDPNKTVLVADVHTDVNTKQVLEEGSGKLEWLIVARSLSDGTIGASVGPVFSYYELALPMAKRLTDEKWAEMLGSNAPARPAWIGEIRAP